MGELIDKIKGKAKEVQGRATGNKTREAEGLAEQAKGKAKGAFEEAKHEVKRAVRESKEHRPQDAQNRRP